MLKTFRLLDKAGELMKNSKRFEQSPASPGKVILFVGDSTVVGTGADIPEHSIAGRFGAQYPNAKIINRGINGQKIHQLEAELDPTKENKADILVIQIGANDILRFTPLFHIKRDLIKLLEKAFILSKTVVLLHSGRVGDAPFFPKAIGWLWNIKAAQVRRLYIKESKRTGARYVDLFEADLSYNDYAGDLVHPNENGYKIWFEKILSTIQDQF